jgi:hypothetical protein
MGWPGTPWIAVLSACTAIGCYSPSPPAGAYQCSAADKSCPSGQHCTCGLCVKSDDQAACSFAVDSSAATTVNEHQAFPITITAYRADAAVAGGFNGTVTLAASWGDVSPSTVTLANGRAQAMVALNRETLPPQTATITATFAGNKGTSGKIGVVAPPFVRDATPIVPPPTSTSTFGFADALVAEPDVILTGAGQYRMYFGGYANSGQFKGYDFGVATSTDGVHFTPNPLPVFQTPMMPMGAQINSPSVYGVGPAWYLAFAEGTSGVINAQDAMLAGPSPDGMSTFPPVGPVVKRTDCAYCDQTVDFPSVIADPGGNGYIMFFSAIHQINAQGNTTANIGRASSPDGVHFAAEPAPILSSDLTDEAVLFAPRVVVDGPVYKMWYSYARTQDIKDLQNLCNDMNRVQIGYATSSDGFYWIRSPSNPAVAVGGGGWDVDSRALLSGSVVPLDGKSSASGFGLYYTTFRTVSLGVLQLCLPSGIGRATRP